MKLSDSKKIHHVDLCIIGGGMAGPCAAVLRPVMDLKLY